MPRTLKIIISGGGTGGHIFPWIAIQMPLNPKHPDADILFVGAKGAHGNGESAKSRLQN
ncbi:MAG: glycosyltransferase [Saprospiraceae bacterium]|nr:glycosyltransferase [Saprospiraceae bacterium]